MPYLLTTVDMLDVNFYKLRYLTHSSVSNCALQIKSVAVIKDNNCLWIYTFIGLL